MSSGKNREEFESWLDLDGRPNTCAEYHAELTSSLEAVVLKVGR